METFQLRGSDGVFEMKNDGDDNTEDGDNDDDAKLTETQRKDARRAYYGRSRSANKVNFAMTRDFAIPPQAEMMMAMPMMKAGMAAPKMEMRAMRVGAGPLRTLRKLRLRTMRRKRVRREESWKGEVYRKSRCPSVFHRHSDCRFESRGR